MKIAHINLFDLESVVMFLLNVLDKVAVFY